MEPITEPRDRFNLRKALLLIERDIKALEEQNIHTLDRNVLQRLDAGDSLAPKLFTSLAPRDMPEPTPEYVDRKYNTDELTRSSDCTLCLDLITHPFRVTRIGDYKIRNLYRTFEPEYGTLSILHVAKASKPHMKCIMHNDLDVDDNHLLCGEVLTIIRTMLGQLKQTVFVNDMVAPILLFSLNRRHPRTFAQWYLGDPIGITSREAVRT
ncbi:hypothetical protein BO99DRAFT_424418 [Aspergillus violaceofuscus CBS 115571]|uniref:Uncharacterized protein n=1 Tax=Aspergillus violaceofuscus (strain CBS 115571) TaxID=1450538 RepID=A0A2V5H0A5_ASPV1|nr:hypothetical protein BO99DRAFT_424418 [Aspergillus violaceofuscus CBS 115571]